MATLSELTAWRDALEKARFAGVRTVSDGGKQVTYGSDAEMRNAIADANRQIAALQGQSSPRAVRINYDKGV